MKKIQPCPACGDKHLYTVYSWRGSRTGFRWKYIECRYCRYAGKPALTKWGAFRKWNRAKNWRFVHEKR